MSNKHKANKLFDEVEKKLHGFRTTPEIEGMIQEIFQQLHGETETEKWHKLIRIVYPMWNGGSQNEVEETLRRVKADQTYCPQLKKDVLTSNCEGCPSWKREACREVKNEWGIIE